MQSSKGSDNNLLSSAINSLKNINIVPQAYAADDLTAPISQPEINDLDENNAEVKLPGIGSFTVSREQVGDVLRVAGETFSAGPRKLGESIAEAFNQGKEKDRLQKEIETAEQLQQIGVSRQERGLDGSKYFESAQKIFDKVAREYETVGEEAQDTRKKAASGAFDTSLTAAGSGTMATGGNFVSKGKGVISPAVNAAVGGTVGAVASVLDDEQSFFEGVGAGIGSSMKYSGLNRAVSPYTSTVTDAFTRGQSVVNQVIARQVGAGLANISEEVLDKAFTENRPPTLNEAAFSFLMGAAFQAVGDIKGVKNGKLKPAENPLFELNDNGKIKPTKQARDNAGRYAKKLGTSPTEAKKQLKEFSDWYNKPIKINNLDGHGSVHYIKRGEAGLLKLQTNQQN